MCSAEWSDTAKNNSDALKNYGGVEKRCVGTVTIRLGFMCASMTAKGDWTQNALNVLLNRHGLPHRKVDSVPSTRYRRTIATYALQNARGPPRPPRTLTP